MRRDRGKSENLTEEELNAYDMGLTKADIESQRNEGNKKRANDILNAAKEKAKSMVLEEINTINKPSGDKKHDTKTNSTGTVLLDPDMNKTNVQPKDLKIPSSMPPIYGTPDLMQPPTQPLVNPNAQADLTSEDMAAYGIEPTAYPDIAKAQSSTPLVDSLTKKQTKIAGGQQPPTEWQPPKQKKDLRWLAALGTGLSGIGAAINPQGNVAQATAPGMKILNDWDDNQQKRYMYAVANDPASPLSVEARKSVGITDKKVSWVMLKELYPELMDQQARAFNRQQESSKFDTPEERRVKTYLQTDAKALYKDIKPFQDMLRSYDMLDKTINESPAMRKQLGDKTFSLDAYNRGELDFPGVNLPILGRLTFYNEQAQDVNTIAKRIFNVTIKDRSGAAVTSQEMERIQEEYADGKYNTEESLFKALKLYKQESINAMKERESISDPDALKMLKERGLTTSEKYDKPQTSDKGSYGEFPGLGKGWLKDGVFTTTDGKKHKIAK